MLHFIDKHWKYHLQRMDNLKEAAHNQVFAQRDPLLTYKFEGLKLFKELLGSIARQAIRCLFSKELLPERLVPLDPQQLPDSLAGLQELKAAVEGQTQQQVSAPKPAAAPLRAAKTPSRNERVSVRYSDGTVKKEVKYKSVAEDLAQKRCVLL